MLSWVAWHNDERALGNRRRAVSLSPYELRSLQTARALAKADTVIAARAAQHHIICTQRVLHRAEKKLHKAQRSNVRTGVAPALGRHCHARSLHSASHTCTLLYNTLDTHAERLKVSLVILILHTHNMYTCTLARCCLDNRVFAACLHGVARLAVACTRAACLPMRSRRASRARAYALLWADLS